MAHQEERGERPAPREGEALEREPSARGGERDGDDGPPPDDVAEPRRVLSFEFIVAVQTGDAVVMLTPVELRRRLRRSVGAPIQQLPRQGRHKVLHHISPDSGGGCGLLGPINKAWDQGQRGI